MFENKQVLIIDDADTIRTYLRNVLAPKKAIIDGAATGHEGLTKCTDQSYDLILLDLLMPDIDGIEVLQQIRAQNDTSTIVMITGHGGIKSAIAAVQLGADGYIEKQDITSTIRDHVEFLYALEQAMDHRAGIVAQKQLEQIRADLYSMITHDLRNPTTLIVMAANILAENTSEPLGPRQREFVGMIEEAAEQLMRLTGDYLDFARIDGGYLRLDFVDADLNQIVEASSHLVQLQTQVKKQTLTVDVPPEPVIAAVDADWIRQVLDNLFSNAVKYTPEGGHIAFRLWTEGDYAIFEVSDTGIGIASDQLPVLFTRYHRVKNAETRGIKGTGLGLIIVKEIVEAHGGTIRVESEGVAGKGSTFTCKIPLTQAARSASAGPLVDAELEPPETSDAPESATGMEDDTLVAAFIRETENHLTLLLNVFQQLRTRPQDDQLFTIAQRAVHTLKGNAGAMQFTAIYDLAVEIEDQLRQVVKGEVPLTVTQLTQLEQLVNRIGLKLAGSSAKQS
jgi:signal transduction histidine kinase/HPt (histidine-containing phosphotransfer) domain-containing protein